MVTSSGDTIPWLPPKLAPVMVEANSSSVSQDHYTSGESGTESSDHGDHDSNAHGKAGGGGGVAAKAKRRRKREVGTAGEGRGEWNLRTTCDGCTVSKVRCNGKKPCARCERRGEECVYSEKRR